MNPYKVLGVSETATPEEIRQAYLELVKKYHPDKYTDNPLKELANEKLKEINEAYDTLTKEGQILIGLVLRRIFGLFRRRRKRIYGKRHLLRP